MEISLAAEEIVRIAGFSITNTLILAWIAMGILIFFGATSTHKLTPVPGHIQNFFELVVEQSYNFVKGISAPIRIPSGCILLLLHFLYSYFSRIGSASFPA